MQRLEAEVINDQQHLTDNPSGPPVMIIFVSAARESFPLSHDPHVHTNGQLAPIT